MILRSILARSALASLCGSMTQSYAQQLNCAVADPTGSPLNIRDAPESPKILGTLRNGTVVSVERFEDYRGRRWALIKGLGWVYKNYLNCGTSATGAGQKGPIQIDPKFLIGEESAVSETRWLECTHLRKSPPQPPDISKISIQITTGEGGHGRFANYVTGMGVLHHGSSGTYNRADQYVNTYLLSNGDSDYTWSGSRRGDLSTIMEGHLRAEDPKNIDGRWTYTEQLSERDNRSRVSYIMSSACRVIWKQEYGDYDEKGNDIIKPVLPSN